MPRKLATLSCLALLLAVTVGCAKPVKIRSSYAHAPTVEPLEPMVMLTIRDLRGRRVESAAQTTTIDLPDSSNTTVSTYGNTTYATTTYDDNEITVTTGNTLGTSFVEDLDEQIGRFMGQSRAFDEVTVVDVGTLVAMDYDSLARLADRHGVDRIAIVELDSYTFETDTDAKASLWAYLGGLTLGLALPFMPLEKWNAEIHLTGDVYIWETDQGIVARQPLDLDYYQRGPGIPGYRRVLSGVSIWADTKIGHDVLKAVAKAAQAA